MCWSSIIILFWIYLYKCVYIQTFSDVNYKHNPFRHKSTMKDNISNYDKENELLISLFKNLNEENNEHQIRSSNGIDSGGDAAKDVED